MSVWREFVDFFKPSAAPAGKDRIKVPRGKRFIGDDFPLASDFQHAIKGNVFSFTQLSAIRRLVQKSAFLQGYQTQMALNVVGEIGPVPTFQTVANKTDRRNLKMLWDEWTESTGVSGNQNWATMLKSVIKSFSCDGRTFCLIKMDPDYHMGVGIQPISREWLAGSWEGIRPTQREVDGMLLDFLAGVYYKPSGLIYGYEFYKNIILPPLNNIPIPMGREKKFVNAAYVCDLSNINNPYNYDHIPEGILSVITLLSNIANLDESMTQLMRIATHQMGFIEKNSEATILEDIEEYVPPGEIESNIIENLPIGHSFKAFNPATPNADVANYRKEMLKNASATLGLDHATLTGDLEKVNYSSLRHGVIQARDAFKNHQKTLETKVCRKILSVWLDEMIVSRRITLRPKSVLQAKQTKWRHRSYQWVDPQKDALATKQLIAMGITSPQRVATGIGVDFMQILDEFREFLDELEKREITPADLQALSGAAMAVKQEAENGNDESGEEESSEEEGEGKEEEEGAAGGGAEGDNEEEENDG